MTRNPAPLGPDGAAPEDDRYRPGYELVAERLLHYIAEENLRPGDRLPTEQGLAEILGVTRNVTREAVKVLAAIGRLTVRRGAGIFVAAAPAVADNDQLAHYQPTDMEHVLMLLDYRQVIETETARRAASIATPLEVKSIREAALESAEVGAAGDADAFGHADELFHTAVAVAAHNVFLQSSVATVRKFAAQSDVLLFHRMAPGSLEAAGRQHVEIAEAIGAGDAVRAMDLMAQHVDTTRHQFENRIRDRLFSPDTRT
ncbi:FadR/GntR family transcriptional regulator [Catenulispora rubra]|uniref:FadR/GntR family transcriptional regulator n=1 Tax=Catenulispora rubra TaxID=280293 RepID=UPI002B27B5AE|nr:FCD domain-containing protein [Catenulispora rubra]